MMIKIQYWTELKPYSIILQKKLFEKIDGFFAFWKSYCFSIFQDKWNLRNTPNMVTVFIQTYLHNGFSENNKLLELYTKCHSISKNKECDIISIFTNKSRLKWTYLERPFIYKINPNYKYELKCRKF